jgi:hypothetical protein
MIRIMTQWEAASEDTRRVYGNINKHCQYIGYFNKVTTHMNRVNKSGLANYPNILSSLERSQVQQ